MGTQEPTKGGTPNKATLQSYIQNFTREAIDGMVEIMRNSKNPQLKFAATKLIIDKAIPDVKAIEVTGQNGEPIKLNIIAGADFSQFKSSTASSEGSTTYGPTQVQDSGMASTSEKDNNSNQSTGKVDPA